MSTKIDEQVVEMRFDNRNFEKNVQTSMSTLDKFKEKLNFKGMSKGLEDVEKSAKKVDLSPMSQSAEKVGLKFNAMYSMADQAMRNITNSAMNYGKKIVSAFTIDPIKTGFQEYETQINSVQTILANTESKGSTLQDVNNALGELNAYADKTIYNFTEMTRNIGTFTAAGVDLKTSVAAIKGIANLAAVSGSTSQQASTAMYQLSQALSSGTVKLMDWNSVVNAGMGGQVFQDSLKETARVHGIAIDEMIEQNGSFRETLQEGWLTSEILTETLSKFTGDLSEEQLKSMGYTDEQIKKIIKMGNTANDAATKVKTFTQLFDTLKEAAQSGWTKSWELLIGDFGEAKGLLTDISNFLGDIIGKTGDKRNAMLMGGLSTGWKQLLNEGINDAAGFEEMVSKVAKEHGVDIASMIDDETSFQDVLKKSLKEGTLNSEVLGESISKFAEKVSNMSAKELEAAGYTEEHVKKLKELNDGVKNGSISMEKFTELIIRPSGRELLIESLWNSIKALESVLTPVKEAFSEFFPAMEGEQLYKLIEKLRDFTAKLTLSGEQAENLKRTFRGVFAVLDIGVQIIKSIAGGFVSLVRYIAPAGNGLLSFTGDIGDFLVKINAAAKSSDIFNKAIEGIGKILKPIADGVKEFANVIGESFADISKQSEERFGPLSAMSNAIKAVFVGLGKVLGKLAPWVSKLATATGEVFSSMMDKITSSIQGADYNSFFDLLNGGIFSAIGVFIARFMKGASDITAGAGDFMDNINDILEGVGDAINSFSESIKAKTLKTIATAIAILAASLLVLSLIDSEKLTGSLAAITVLFGELMASMSIFGKITDGNSFKNINKVSRAMIKMSAALLILAVAMKIMSTMSYNEMAVGIISTIVGIGSLVLAVNALPPENVIKASKAIKKLSSSLVIFAIAMKIMGTMSWTEMGVGLVTTVVGLGALVAAVNLLPKDASLRVAGMLGLATALVMLGASFKIISSMSIDELGIALFGVVIGLGALVAAVNLLPKSTMIKVAGMIGLATALVILAGALKIMASMSWDEIARGLVMLGGSLLVIIAALLLMKGTIAGAAALLIVASSLAVLAPVMKILGSMSWEEIAKGLVALAGAFAVIGIAGLLLTPLILSILGLAAAIALLGIGCAAIGAGVVLVAAGITALSVALAAGGGAIVVFISSLVGLIPYIIQQIGIGLISLCDVISGSADSICKAFTVIVLALVDAIVASVPALVDGTLILIESLLQSLVEHAPKIVGGLCDFIIAIINTLSEKLPDLIQAGVNLLMSLFVGVIDSLKSIDPEILVKGIVSIGLITALLLALSFIASLVPGAMLGVLGVAAVVAEIAILLAAIGALAQIPGLEWLVSEGGDFLQTIGTAIGQFIGGIVGGIAQGISSGLPQIGTDLSDFMTNVTPFIEGIKMVDKQVLDSVGVLAEAIIALAAANLITAITEFLSFGSSFADLGTELSQFMINAAPFIEGASTITEEMANAVKNIAQTILILTAADVINGLTSWLTGGSSFATFGEDLKPLGEGLKSFGESIKDWTPETAEKVNLACEAIKYIAEAAEKIPNEGGWAGAIFGENGLGAFADELPNVGANLGLFASSLSANGFTSSSASIVEEAANALSALAGVKIANEGGAWAKFWGDNTLSAFASNLGTVGEGISSFCGYMQNSNITKDSLETAKNAASTIAALAGIELPKSNGSWQDFWGGTTTLESFCNQLPSVGESLSSFVTNVGTFDDGTTATVTCAIDLFKSLAALSDKNLKSLKTVGSNIKSFGKSFKSAIATITKTDAETVTNACANISKIVDTVKNIDGLNTEIVTTFTDALKNLSEDGIENFITVFENADVEAVKCINSFIKSTAEGVKTEENQDKFESVGKYLVEGIAAGIKNNTGVVGTAARQMIQDIATAAQDEAIIESPSKLFEKLIGKFIPQGVARGIEKDTSAEEAAEKKVQSIADAFGKALEELSLMTEKNDLEYDLWESQNSDLGDAAKSAEKLKTLTENMEAATAKTEVAHHKYKTTVEALGEDSKYAKEAWNEYLQAAIDEQNLINEINETKQNSVKSLEELTRENEDLEYELWLAMHPNASLADKHAVELHKLDDDRYELSLDEVKAWKKYNKLLKDSNYGPNHADTIAAKNEWDAIRIEYANINNRITEIQEESVQDRLDSAKNLRDATKEAADIEYETWELMHPKATDAEKDTAEIKRLTAYRVEAGAESYALLKEYKKIQKDKTATEAEILAAKNTYEAALNEEKKIDKQIADIQESALEREVNNLENQRKLLSDIAKLKYDIWEATYGDDATDEEKDAKKLEMLNEQAIIQTQLLATAQEEYNKVLKETGDASSNEALQAQSDLLNAQLALAQLKGQILDIEEEAAKRKKKLQDKQRIAQSDYEEYIKKYKKYYLENGMTIEDLERDAKLISGYDPSKVVNEVIRKNSPQKTVSKMLTETSNALDNIESDTTYKGIVENLGEIGSSYLTAVSEGMTNNMIIVTDSINKVVDACIKALEKRYVSFKDSGVYLVKGFNKGISSYVTKAAQEAAAMAASALDAANRVLGINSPSKVFERIGMYVDMGLAQGIRKYATLAETETTDMSGSVIDRFRSTISQIADAINSDIDTQPTIRPVLDLSEVKSGTARINAMFSRSQALSASAGIEANRRAQIQNGNDDTVTSGNTYTFTQNNYSPKALSPTEIYRQTRNQFTAMKEALNK